MISLLLAYFLGTPTVSRDVVFSEPNHVRLLMDVYQPSTPHTDPLPGVIVIHGGTWMAGAKEDMAALCAGMADQGLVAATVEYRLAPTAKWPAMLDDVQSAVRYLRAHAKAYGVDPNHVGACGASAGGQLALLLGNRDTRDPNPADNPAVSSRVSVVFDMFGPTDLSRDFPASFDFLSVLVTGKKKEDAGPEIREMSVMNFLGANSPPTFILHGLADPLVPPVQSQRLEDSLKQLNVPVQGVYIKGMVHGIDAKIPGELDAVGAGIRWLKTYLEPKASGGKAA